MPAFAELSDPCPEKRKDAAERQHTHWSDSDAQDREALTRRSRVEPAIERLVGVEPADAIDEPLPETLDEQNRGGTSQDEDEPGWEDTRTGSHRP